MIFFCFPTRSITLSEIRYLYKSYDKLMQCTIDQSNAPKNEKPPTLLAECRLLSMDSPTA